MARLRSKFELAMVVAWLKRSGETGMTLDELRDKTDRPGVEDAVQRLRKAGLVRKLDKKNDRYALPPDHVHKLV